MLEDDALDAQKCVSQLGGRWQPTAFARQRVATLVRGEVIARRDGSGNCQA